jgi:acetyl coenzyme A synthetase (ADP forming)-like protein
MDNDSLSPFFTPQGVAVIGASREPVKLGYQLARNLVQSGYTGAVHFVNPRGGTLLGRPIYTSVEAVPDPVDLAVVLVPPPAVPAALHECGRRGIKAVIVATGGFRETGPEGAALEEQLLVIAHEYGMRLVGPNCVGLINNHLPLDTTFLPPPGPPKGDVAFISHSGAICAVVIDWVRGQGFGLSHLVSLGNQADVSETEALGPVAADPKTRVVTLYLEGISDGRRFVEEAARVVREKPVVALKVGRFESGRRAAASHTGALAGAEEAFDAAFRRSGVLRAATMEEMFHWAQALAWCPLPKGRNVAVLTNAGGPGVTTADALELNGLRLASLSAETQAALKALLPPAASVHNPVDMLAGATLEQHAESLRLLLADANVDAVIVIIPPSPVSSAGAVARAIIPVIQASDKPVLAAVMGDRLVQEAIEHLRAARVVEYRFPERAASALSVLAQRAEWLAAGEQKPITLEGVDTASARSILAHHPQDGFLPANAAAGLLEAYGVRAAPMELARSAEEAVHLAQKAGYPVVLKIASADITHKSDVGGVLLDLRDAKAVAQGYDAIMRNAATAEPKARIDGVHVQRMLPPGQEVIVGVVRDAQFGPLVMFGSGGVEVEGLKDVAFALAPLTERDAQGMLERTWAGRKLRGYRNLPPADRQATLQALARLAQLAWDFPEIAEVEINPLRVLAEGQGAYAVDVRARLVHPAG